MSKLLKKTNWRSALSSKMSLAVLALIIVGLSISVFDRYQIEREVSARLEAKEAELKILEERKGKLEEKVNYLSNDWGVEAEIRKHFDVAREGEQVVVLLEGALAPIGLSSSSDVFNSPGDNFWSWLLPW